jgi:3-oxoacyl-[acyl-carrier-protein] synthase II
MRRVVITGIGLVTPLGGNAKTSWDNLLEGKSGIKQIDSFDVSDLPAKIAGLVPHGDQAQGLFDPDQWMEPKEQRKVDRFIVYGVAAASQAIEDSGWKPEDDESCYRTGVMIGSGIGGLPNIYETSIILHTQGARRVSPFFIPSCLINLTSGHVSIKYGFKGPNHSAVTACSTGAHAIGDAARLIQCDEADVMVAGGTEAAVCRLGMAGFASARALSTKYNDTPQEASRPWDSGRDGFVMGEGAGIVVLEELEHALKRGAKIYAEYKGSGLTGDAFHITSPSGDGAYRAMVNAMKKAGFNPEDVQYVNAHGTSTPVGDASEAEAAQKAFGIHAKKIAMSSTKSAIGHLLGAAGGVESIFSILAIRDNILPPTLNLNDPSEGCDMDFVPLEARQTPVTNVLCNSFGFGGTNVSVAFSRYSK